MSPDGKKLDVGGDRKMILLEDWVTGSVSQERRMKAIFKYLCVFEISLKMQKVKTEQFQFSLALFVQSEKSRGDRFKIASHKTA